MSTTTQLGDDQVTVHPGTVHFDPAPGLLGLDVESTYMGDQGQWTPGFQVRTVQFATRRSAWVYDLADPGQREKAGAILSDPAFTFCSHTNMDVLAVWVAFGIDISDRNLDTRMLAIQAEPGKEHDRDLKSLAAEHGMPELQVAATELALWMRDLWVEDGGRKNAKKADIERKGWDALARIPAHDWPEVFTRYAGLDAIACRRLAELLVPKTQAPVELLRVDQWLHVRSNRLQMAGKRVDIDALEALHSESKQFFTQAKAEAEELTGGVNVNGPKVIGWLAEHGVDWNTWPGALTPTGAPSLAKENLKLLGNYELDEVGQQVAMRMGVQQTHADMLRKTEDIKRRLDDGGRVHPLLNPIGATTTARMSSSGPNMQNMSKKDGRLRGLFLFDPVTTGATIDFAQIELRVVAALAREEVMIETIRSGGDLHQLTVDELAQAGVTITRDQAKIVNFLIVYGGGAFALHTQTGIPLAEATMIIDAWRQRYQAISALATYLGYERDAIRTISNRRLPVSINRKTGQTRHYANINYAVQSAARELLVDAWRRLEVDHGRAGIVWWPIHDELVLQIPDDEVDAVLADAEDSMRMEFRGVPVTADAVVLRDRAGVSRWMTSKAAEAIQKEQAA